MVLVVPDVNSLAAFFATRNVVFHKQNNLRKLLPSNIVNVWSALKFAEMYVKKLTNPVFLVEDFFGITNFFKNKTA